MGIIACLNFLNQIYQMGRKLSRLISGGVNLKIGAHKGSVPLCSQYRYVLNRNTVIQNIKDKRIVTVFSDMPATSIHVKGYKIPWR